MAGNHVIWRLCTRTHNPFLRSLPRANISHSNNHHAPQQQNKRARAHNPQQHTPQPYHTRTHTRERDKEMTSWFTNGWLRLGSKKRGQQQPKDENDKENEGWYPTNKKGACLCGARARATRQLRFVAQGYTHSGRRGEVGLLRSFGERRRLSSSLARSKRSIEMPFVGVYIGDIARVPRDFVAC